MVSGSANKFITYGFSDYKKISERLGEAWLAKHTPAFFVSLRVLPREYDSGMRNMLYYYLQGVPTIRTFLTAKKSF